MEDLRQRVAYLKGLAEGLDMDDESKEGRLFGQIIDLLDSMTMAVENLESDYEELYDYVEAVDQDLTDMERDFYEEPFEEGEELEGFTLECPDCGEIVFIDEEAVEDEELEVLCPNCHRVVFVQDEAWEADEEEEDLEED